jgi:hypothetical protein
VHPELDAARFRERRQAAVALGFAATLLLAAALPLLAPSVAHGASDPARSDTTRAVPARPDTTRSAQPAPTSTVTHAAADTTQPRPGAPRDSMRVTVRGAGPRRAHAPEPARGDTVRVGPMSVDFNEQRKRGDVTLGEAFQGHRAALLVPIPLYGPPVGSMQTPDVGSRVRLSDLDLMDPDGATQRTLISGSEFGIGIPDLAMTIDSPNLQGVETLDWNALPYTWAPDPFTRPGMLASEPSADPGLLHAMPGERAPARRMRSALYYGNGDNGEKQAGAEFTSATLARGIAGSYMRQQSDGLLPLGHSKSTRYSLAAGLPTFLGHTLWVQGRIFDWDLEDRSAGIDSFTGLPTEVRGRAEIDARDLALHARAGGARWDSRWLVQASGDKRTSVEALGAREGWELPEERVSWNGSAGTASGWTALLGADLATRIIRYRAAVGENFDIRRNTARVQGGLRKSLGQDAGVEGVVAGDWREGDATFADGRASIWRRAERAAGRIDLEWAHERPSWYDQLAPLRTWTGFRSTDFYPIHLEREGNPALQPRLLAGAIARGSYDVSRALSIEVEGSVRHVEHDFGWTVTRVESPDSLFVTTRAADLGHGIVSYGGLALRYHSGPVALRGEGWARGGPETLSPIAGGPPRVGADASLDSRIVLFQGDLPLEAGIEMHARGAREGIIRAPGVVSFDAALRADLGAAGLFLEFLNAFDRHDLPSAVLDLSDGSAAPMPGRAMHIGIVWYLFD